MERHRPLLEPVTFRLTQANQAGVERTASELGIRKADVIRRAISEFIQRRFNPDATVKPTLSSDELIAQLRALPRTELEKILQQLEVEPS